MIPSLLHRVSSRVAIPLHRLGYFSNGVSLFLATGEPALWMWGDGHLLLSSNCVVIYLGLTGDAHCGLIRPVRLIFSACSWYPLLLIMPSTATTIDPSAIANRYKIWYIPGGDVRILHEVSSSSRSNLRARPDSAWLVGPGRVLQDTILFFDEGRQVLLWQCAERPRIWP